MKESKTCVECRYLGNAKETGLCEKRQICLYPEKLPACSKFEQKYITNGDVIRQMSDEQLALLIVRGRCALCPYSYDVTDCYNNTEKSCKDIILEQLKQEHKYEEEMSKM